MKNMENLQKTILDALWNGLSFELDKLIIEGLKRKGFEFENKKDLESFIKEKCRVEDNISKKEKIFFVDDVPFFLYNYEYVIEPFDYKLNKISATHGRYAFL